MMESSDLKSTLTRIKNTTELLRQIKSSNLELEKNVFLSSMFANTPLDRSEDPDPIPESEDVILRKNIYYIASKIPNPNELILTLMHHGLLNSEEIEEILPQKDNLIKSICVLACVITKEQGKFPAFIKALRQSNNPNLADMFENLTRQPVYVVDEGPENPNSWSCQNCTFLNTSSNTCQMCFKSKDYTKASASCMVVCQTCTFFNPPGNSHCEMCNNQITSEVTGEDEKCCLSAVDQYFDDDSSE